MSRGISVIDALSDVVGHHTPLPKGLLGQA
jgi:hypothetical protein